MSLVCNLLLWPVAATSGAERRVQITLEVTPTTSPDSLCPHLHSLDGSLLTMIWHRWRHWHLGVYSRCPILLQGLENTSVITAGTKAFAFFFSVCYGNEMWEPLQKIWTTQKCRGEQEKGKEVAQAVLCKDVLTALEPCHTLPLLLCLQTLTLSPKHNVASALGRLSSWM